MARTLSRVLLGLAGVLLSTSASAKTTLTMHTPGPEDGAWGKVFQAWANVVKKNTNGQVELDPRYNEKLGAEPVVIEMVKQGTVGGGFFTTRGLGELDKGVLALQVRGAYQSWAEFDQARSWLEPDLVAAWRRNNVRLVGWADVGIGRFMSRGFPVTDPASLQRRTVAIFDGDVISPRFFSKIKDSSTTVLSTDDILLRLEGKKIDVVTAPAYAAEQLGWSSRLDHISSLPLFFAAGAVVVSQKKLSEMSEEQAAIVLKTGERATKVLDKKLDTMGYSSYERLKGRMRVHTPTNAEKAAWQAVFQKACRDLAGVVPQSALDKTKACQ